MRFFDFRKYIFANLLSLLAYVDTYISILYTNTGFPSPVPSSMWGEPIMILSFKEERFIDISFIIFCLMYLFFCLFFIEFLIRVLVFLVRKFILKKADMEIKKKKTVILKVAEIVYSIIFYIGFILSFHLFF